MRPAGRADRRNERRRASSTAAPSRWRVSRVRHLRRWSLKWPSMCMRPGIARCDWNVRGEDGAAHDDRRRDTASERAFDAIFRAVLREKAGPCDRGRRAPARDRRTAGRSRGGRRRRPAPYRRHTSAIAARSTKSAAEWALRCRSRAASSKDTADESGRRRHRRDRRRTVHDPLRRIGRSAIITLPLTELTR